MNLTHRHRRASEISLERARGTGSIARVGIPEQRSPDTKLQNADVGPLTESPFRCRQQPIGFRGSATIQKVWHDAHHYGASIGGAQGVFLIYARRAIAVIESDAECLAQPDDDAKRAP